MFKFTLQETRKHIPAFTGSWENHWTQFLCHLLWGNMWESSREEGKLSWSHERLSTLPETNKSHLKHWGWFRWVSFWCPASCQVLWLLVLRSVSKIFLKLGHPKRKIHLPTIGSQGNMLVAGSVLGKCVLLIIFLRQHLDKFLLDFLGKKSWPNFENPAISRDPAARPWFSWILKVIDLYVQLKPQ